MPFEFGNPKPPHAYDPPHGRSRRYWPCQNSIEHLAYTPNEIRSWGSVKSITEPPPPLRPKDCYKKCFNKSAKPYYAENYLREYLLLDNPTLVPAIKNTPLMRDVPEKPIKFVPPHFIHRSKRSQFHLLIPQKYRTALCKITSNLYQEHELVKKELVSRKGREAAAKEIASIPSLATSTESIPSLKVKSEGFLNNIRKKVEEELKLAEEKKLDKRFFPSSIEFDINHKKKSKSRKQRFGWEKEGGMEAMCANYPGTSLFHESPSHIGVEATISEELPDPKLVKTTKEHLQQIPPEMLQLFLNAPRQATRRPLISPDQYQEFNHFGLLETSKSVALESCLKKMYKRDRRVKVPPELLKNIYGPLKGMPPGFRYERPKLAYNLETDCPPTKEELIKVEHVMKKEKKARRNRKAQGVQSEESLTRIMGQFSKPTIESQENVTLHSQKKSFMTLEDYPKKHNELTKRDSSDSLFCEVGAVKMEQEKKESDHPNQNRRRKQTWIVDMMAKSSAALVTHKIVWKEQVDLESAKTRQIPTLADMMSLSSESSEEEVDEDSEEMEEYGRKPSLSKIKDSRELLPYPDIAFSAIHVPDEIEDAENNWLYRKLAEDQLSVSSSKSSDEDQNKEEEEEEDEYLEEGISDTSILLDKIFKKAQPHFTASHQQLKLPSSNDEVRESPSSP